MKRAHIHTSILIFVVAALIAAFIATPIAATTMVSLNEKQVNAGGAVLIQANLGKVGDTAKIEYYYDYEKKGIDNDPGSVWTTIAVVKDGGQNNLIPGPSGQIEYRWVPPASLAHGQYLIRVTDSDNSTPIVAPIDITNPTTPQISFLVNGTATNRVSPGGFVQVSADVLNNCALCHSGDPSTWNASNPGFDQQKMAAHITADLSGLTGNPNDTAVPAEMMLGHGVVGWNVQLSPNVPEGTVGQVYIQVTQANLTISSHNATAETNATTNATANTTSNATNILNETNRTESNTTLTITAISAPAYQNDTVSVNVTVLNRGADTANSTYLVFPDLPKDISVDNGGALDIASNSTAVFSVNITALTGASGNYDLSFHAISGNLTSENETIPIQIGNVAASSSGNPLPGFDAAFAVAGLVVAAYVVTRRR
ncbi:MAG: PGF-CTERM sorting domain-containing protein [Halobacteriota archaeon]|jgi:PGF-CTERM protein